VPTKLPYPTASFEANTTQPGVQARTVGYGIRTRYIGPELARSGQIIGIRHPDNETLVGLSSSQCRSYQTAKTFSNKRQWVYASYRPVRPNEYEFSADPCTASDGNNYKFPLGVLITGTTDTSGAPGPAPFEFEIVQYVEFIGNVDNITRSHTDVAGMSHIRNSIPVKSVTDNLTRMAAQVTQKVQHSMKEALPLALPAAAAYGAHSLMSGGAPAVEEEVAERALVPYVGEAAEAAGSTGFLSSIEGIGSTALAGMEEFAPLLLAAL
jgi:hypothetical protein